MAYWSVGLFYLSAGKYVLELFVNGNFLLYFFNLEFTIMNLSQGILRANSMKNAWRTCNDFVYHYYLLFTHMVYRRA